jgi:hypothetical protein
MGGIGTSLHIKRAKNATSTPNLEDFFYEVDNKVKTLLLSVLRRRSKRLGRGKPGINVIDSRVLHYMGMEGVRDRFREMGRSQSTDKELYFSFDDFGDFFQEIAVHWYQLAFAYGFKRLDSLAKGYGFRIDSSQHQLLPLLLAGLHTPFFGGIAQYFSVTRIPRAGDVQFPPTIVPAPPIKEDDKHWSEFVTEKNLKAKILDGYDPEQSFTILYPALTGYCFCTLCEEFRIELHQDKITWSSLAPLLQARKLMGSSSENEALLLNAAQELAHHPPVTWEHGNFPPLTLQVNDWLRSQQVEIPAALLPGMLLTWAGLWWNHE